ncbi:MAG: hypothetical protein QXD15_03925, partial [Thermoplasmata archaeon]
NAEAMEFFKEALEAMEGVTEENDLKLEVLWEYEEVLELDGRYPEVLEVLEKIINLTISERPVEAARAYRRCCAVRFL